MVNPFKDPLDALLEEAVAIQANRRVKAMPSGEKAIKHHHESFFKPENWQRTRGVAIIHRASDDKLTLLGNFTEYRHKLLPSARKLIREAAPIPIDGEEYVMGSIWTARAKDILFPARLGDEEDVELTLDLTFTELGVFASKVKVCVRTLHNAIYRVELIEQTQFISPTNQMFIYFPAGLDILGAMSFDCKMELRRALNI